MDQFDDLLTEEEMAERLGYTRAWLRSQRLAGNGPAFMKLGNRIMYDPADVRAWLETLKTKPTSAQ